MLHDDGGQAYPYVEDVPTVYTLNTGEKVAGEPVEPVHREGLTLLDYFAGQAMAGQIPDLAEAIEAMSGADLREIHENMADIAYRYADAMIKEKRRREKP